MKNIDFRKCAATLGAVSIVGAALLGAGCSNQNAPGGGGVSNVPTPTKAVQLPANMPPAMQQQIRQQEAAQMYLAKRQAAMHGPKS